MTIEEAHNSGTIASEIICYFIAKAQIFLTEIGIEKSTIRFRQRKSNEIAHYASDCWDAEI